jgi:hypothetical protein
MLRVATLRLAAIFLEELICACILPKASEPQEPTSATTSAVGSPLDPETHGNS